MRLPQFDPAVQQPILAEMDHVLARSYVPQAEIDQFLSIVANSAKLAGPNPKMFWSGVDFLDVSAAGSSQHWMLQRFWNVLRQLFGERTAVPRTNTFIYLDDFSFTGNRILTDLTAWIETKAPPQATVHIVVIGYHASGKYYADTQLAQRAQKAQKNITFRWWKSIGIEDRLSETNSSDVLRPTSIPADCGVQDYVATLKYKPRLRTPGNIGGLKLFSSEAGRNLLEQEFLRAGVRIRGMCPNLGIYQRPLGNMVLESLGFGAMTVTARNCPNNAPLALWVGDPWYPLFPRRTN
ncbi:phosphoribosyltransferase-like protein [Paraburkholderia sp. MM6662-R1]|uniref:phosphoribosyltransferase-like protein n=1 Tax=Paraburkholderia sp. MM6662-R1 TaxID=2991066 RepID=UPI003D1C5DD3